MRSIFKQSRSALRATALSATAVLALTGCSTVLGNRDPEPAGQVTIVSGQQSQNGALLATLMENVNKSPQEASANLQMSNDSDVNTAQKALLDISARQGTRRGPRHDRDLPDTRRFRRSATG